MEQGYGRPYRIDLDLTENCNLRCRFCKGAQAYRYKGLRNEVGVKQLLRAVRDAAELGVENWTLSGSGEATYRLGDCLAVMRAIKKHGMYGALTTNGTLLYDAAIQEIVRMGWNHIIISLDAPHVEVHDYLRGVPGVFARVMETIDSFNDAKETQGARDPLLCFQAVMTSQNCTLCKELIQLGAEKHVEQVNFQPLVYSPGEGTPSPLHMAPVQMEELKTSIPAILREAGRCGVATNLGAYLEKPLMENVHSMQNILTDVESSEHPLLRCPCFVPWHLIVIRADGRVTPCHTICNNQCNNLKETPLRKIWTGEYFTRFREHIAQGKIFNGCEECCSGTAIEELELRERLKSAMSAVQKDNDKA